MKHIPTKSSPTSGRLSGESSYVIRELSLWRCGVEISGLFVAQIRCAACSTPSPFLAIDGASIIQANCEYIMNHRIDTDSPEFSFLPNFGRAIQDLWVEEIIPVLQNHPSRLLVDDNAA